MTNRLLKLRVDEVSVVDKAANGKKFLILKRASESVEKVIKHEGDKWVIYSEDGSKKLGSFDTKKEATTRLAEIEAFKDKKVAKHTFIGWLQQALRKAAGNSGPTTEVDEMTAEEIKKAIADGAAEALTPFDERIRKLEEAATPTGDDDGAAEGDDAAGGDGATAPVAKAGEESEATGTPLALTEEQITKMITDGVAEALKPMGERIQKLEEVQGERQSGLDEEGAHKVKKGAGGLWDGLLF